MDPSPAVETKKEFVLGERAIWLQLTETKHDGLDDGLGKVEGVRDADELRDGVTEAVLDADTAPGDGDCDGDGDGDCAGSLYRHDSVHTRTSPLGSTALPRGRTPDTRTVMGPSGSRNGMETMRLLE
jgi:hypothetical protein